MAGADDLNLNASLRDVHAMIREYGLNHIGKLSERCQSEFAKEPVNICIAGDYGVGKSSLLASLLSASVDRGDIREPKQYRSTDFPGAVFWDYPAELLKNNKDVPQPVANFDVLVVCSCRRFTELDFNLALLAKEHQLALYYIRTKLDNDVDNDRRDRGSDFSEQGLILSIKTDAENNLNEAGFDKAKNLVKIFTLSTISSDRERWDFPALRNEFRRNCPGKNYSICSRQITDAAYRHCDSVHRDLSARIPAMVDSIVRAEQRSREEALHTAIQVFNREYASDTATVRLPTEPSQDIVKMIKSGSLDVSYWHVAGAYITWIAALPALFRSLEWIGWIPLVPNKLMFVTGNIIAIPAAVLKFRQQKSKIAICIDQCKSLFVDFNTDTCRFFKKKIDETLAKLPKRK